MLSNRCFDLCKTVLEYELYQSCLVVHKLVAYDQQMQYFRVEPERNNSLMDLDSK